MDTQPRSRISELQPTFSQTFFAICGQDSVAENQGCSASIIENGKSLTQVTNVPFCQCQFAVEPTVKSKLVQLS